jgi:hypothetical protein
MAKIPITDKMLRASMSPEEQILWEQCYGLLVLLVERIGCDCSSFGTFLGDRVRRLKRELPKRGAKTKKFNGRKFCEDCQQNFRLFGLPSDRKKRWCADCGSGHAGAVDLSIELGRLCRGCQVVAASFAVPPETKPVWCMGCAKTHAPGAVNVQSKKCEDCLVRQASFAIPTAVRTEENKYQDIGIKKRWCGSCARAHPGASQRVPRCHSAPPRTVPDRTPPWVAPSMSRAVAPLAGAQDIVSKKCEACSLRKASFVLVTDSKVRNSLSDCEY